FAGQSILIPGIEPLCDPGRVGEGISARRQDFPPPVAADLIRASEGDEDMILIVERPGEDDIAEPALVGDGLANDLPAWIELEKIAALPAGPAVGIEAGDRVGEERRGDVLLVLAAVGVLASGLGAT